MCVKAERGRERWTLCRERERVRARECERKLKNKRESVLNVLKMPLIQVELTKTKLFN